MTFQATLFLAGKTATGIEVPAEIVSSLGAGKRPAVKVTLNGVYTYRSTVAPYDGRILLPVAAPNTGKPQGSRRARPSRSPWNSTPNPG